ncbi:MAG: hypothetical protein IBJ00_03830 [Alphaproteobacteria bacterium]|nr:hypothetical protein [Alphaproteobacteria bacterium]
MAFTNVAGKAFASCSTSPDPIMIERFKTRVFGVLFSGKIEEPGTLKDIIKTEKIDPNAKFDRFSLLGEYVSQSPTPNVRQVLKTLQELGADIKAVQAERNQAHIMHLAVAPIGKPCNSEIIFILHDLGADIEARNI